MICFTGAWLRARPRRVVVRSQIANQGRGTVLLLFEQRECLFQKSGLARAGA